MTPFLILAMPRSRSFWVAKFLSYAGLHVEHDPSRFFRDRSDVRRFFDEGRCAVDTGLGYIWPLASPANAHVGVLDRPVDQVMSSCRRIGEPFDEARLDILSGRLARLRRPYFWFDGLREEAECRRLFEWATRKPFDRDWWMAMKDRHLECDRRQYRIDAIRNSEGLMNLYGAA